MTNAPSCDNCGEYPGSAVSEEIESLRAALDSMRGRYRLYAGRPDFSWGVGDTDAAILKMADDALGNTTKQKEEEK